MKAPVCGSADTRNFLSNTPEPRGTGLRIFNVQATGRDFPLGVPVAIVNSGRTKTPGCLAHLAVGSASDCSNLVAKEAGANSPGAQQWVMQNVGKSNDGTQLVVIYSAVSGRLVRTGLASLQVSAAAEAHTAASLKYPCPLVFPPLPCRPGRAARSATWAPAPPTATMQRYRSSRWMMPAR